MKKESLEYSSAIVACILRDSRDVIKNPDKFQRAMKRLKQEFFQDGRDIKDVLKDVRKVLVQSWIEDILEFNLAGFGEKHTIEFYASLSFDQLSLIHRQLKEEYFASLCSRTISQESNYSIKN